MKLTIEKDKMMLLANPTFVPYADSPGVFIYLLIALGIPYSAAIWLFVAVLRRWRVLARIGLPLGLLWSGWLVILLICFAIVQSWHDCFSVLVDGFLSSSPILVPLIVCSWLRLRQKE